MAKKIAITATGKTLDAELDPRFGRAQYILITDLDGSIEEVIDNAAGRAAAQGAGIQAGKAMADRQVDVLLTGHCGPNAFRTLAAAGIKVGINLSGTVAQALENLRNDTVEFADQPNVEGHW
jgi:predicted Fe-Mo cluster-binding NifX family protein